MYSFGLCPSLLLLAAVLSAAAPAASNTSILAAEPAGVEDSKTFNYCKYEDESNPKGNIRNDVSDPSQKRDLYPRHPDLSNHMSMGDQKRLIERLFFCD